MREQAGMLIRECKEHWMDALSIACAYELAAESIIRDHSSADTSMKDSIHSRITLLNHDMTTELLPSSLLIEDIVLSAKSIATIQRYQCLQYLWANILHLEHAHEMKAMIDGTELIALLPTLKKGPLVGKMMDEQIRWMLRYPEGSKEELVRFLQTVLGESKLS
jgi:hypothetical protein